MQKIIKTHPGRFEMKCAGIVRGWHKKKRNIVCQRAACENVQGGKTESVSSRLLFKRSAEAVINAVAVCALAMPAGSNAHTDWPVRSLLPTGGRPDVSY